ncbi:MAG: rRNA maturation RNase YbeY [Actinomycetota bacterium]|nr:rRNA maturation RNase YbeY [Actinomycetota bacterium]
MTIEVNNESGTAVDEVALAELARSVLDALGVTPLAELSIVLVDSAAMATLHEQWMDLPGPTDVMAFPMDSLPIGAGSGPVSGPGAPPEPGPALLGDVILCPPVAATQAATAGHSTESELFLLTTHGVLHLLGYDHGEDEEEAEMFDLQTRLVNDWTAATGRATVRTPRPGSRGEQRR